MSNEPAKTRLVIAVFEGEENLCSSLAELLRGGFDRAQLGAMMLASTLSRLRAWGGAQALPAEVTNILERFDRTPVVLAPSDVLLSHGTLWQRIGNLQAAAGSDDFIAATWMKPELQADLTRFIRAGAVVLGVSARTFDQQRQSTRILLARSSHRVQTHEFSEAS